METLSEKILIKISRLESIDLVCAGGVEIWRQSLKM